MFAKLQRILSFGVIPQHLTIKKTFIILYNEKNIKISWLGSRIRMVAIIVRTNIIGALVLKYVKSLNILVDFFRNTLTHTLFVTTWWLNI